MRTPTEKQFARLRVLAVGTAGLSWSRREAEPLLRHGWITARFDGRYFQWVEITPDGLRAVALGLERYGLPKMQKGVRHPKVCTDCGAEWSPVCRGCGSRTYRFGVVEHQRVAA